MSAIAAKEALITHWTLKLKDLLQDRNNLSEDDLGYLVSRIEPMRDERLKSCVATLVGWGTEERAELETFCSIALELMAEARPSRLGEMARRVELKAYLKGIR